MRYFKFIIGLLLIFGLSECISDVAVNIENSPAEIIMNSILNPMNDTVFVSLSYTKSIDFEQPFEAIENAKIELFTGEKSVGKFLYADSSRYYLPIPVKPGETYRIEAETGEKKVWAETTVPAQLNASAEKLSPSIEGYQFTFMDNPDENNYYWVTATGYERLLDTSYQDTLIFNFRNKIADIIFSDYRYADDFNRYISEFGRYKFEYRHYIRFSDNQLPDTLLQVRFRPMTGESPEIFIFSTDYHLDKYMKSSLLLERMELLAEDMPVIYSPQPVYSNVHGGTGIFGSFTSFSKAYEKN
ncbi:MAG TPA: DUF4249 domain-containing protein [Prolixibacteraceae bacterium]|nr:DUF4249 domain-containing protein [Prolixibacteraceae bacterium]